MVKRARPPKSTDTIPPPPDRRAIAGRVETAATADQLRLQLEAPQRGVISRATETLREIVTGECPGDCANYTGVPHGACQSPNLLTSGLPETSKAAVPQDFVELQQTAVPRRPRRPPLVFAQPRSLPPPKPDLSAIIGELEKIVAGSSPDSGSLKIPMICSSTKQRLVVSFVCGDTTQTWRLQSVLRNSTSDEGAEGPAAQKIPIGQLDFSGACCPECRKALGPVECGRCMTLGCEGGLRNWLGARTYTCPQCSNAGEVLPNLHEIDAVRLGTAARAAPDPVGPRALALLSSKSRGQA